MKTKWTECSTLQELAAAQARGDEIDNYVGGEWGIWDETAWNKREEYRCRPAKPKSVSPGAMGCASNGTNNERIEK